MSAKGTRLALALVVLVALPAGPARGDDDDPAQHLETRVFPMRYRAVDDAVLLIRPLLGDDASVSFRPRLRAITVTDEPARLDRIALLLRGFDVPPRRVNLVVSLFLGTKGGADGEQFQRARPRPPRPLPGFDATIATLQHTVWTEYRLLGSAAFATAEGEESELSLGQDYRIRLRVDNVNPRDGITHFDRFALERRNEPEAGGVPYRPVWNQVLNLKDNQLYVFGATRMENSQRAIFLSVTAGIER